MPDTRPRDLTAAELSLVAAPPPAGTSGGGDSAPLAVPPGTDVPVQLIDPGGNAGAATTAAPAAPTQLPPGS